MTNEVFSSFIGNLQSWLPITYFFHHSSMFLLLPAPKKFLISSYVPQDSAVEGTLMHMRGPMPFEKADRPSF